MNKLARNAFTLVALLFCVVLIPGRPEALGVVDELGALRGGPPEPLVGDPTLIGPHEHQTVVGDVEAVARVGQELCAA